MKADDSSLDPYDLQVVEQRARDLLNRAGAWEVLPTPIEDILAAANLRVAPTSAFDPKAIVGYMKSVGADAGRWLKSAMSKVLGIYDSNENIIHIDESVKPAKQLFLKFHETGHHELPTHKKMFKFFQDCEKTLAPDIADRFEREANNFARFTLFQGDTFARMTADHEFGIKTPKNLGPKHFKASVYASVREYVRTNQRACAVFVLEQMEYLEGAGARAAVRRIELSPKFQAQFGRPSDQFITLDHPLGRVIPVGGRRMTSARSVRLKDLNGLSHDCLAEAFDTTYNILILVWPVKALTATSIIMPSTTDF